MYLEVCRDPSVAFNWDKVVVPEMYGLKVDFYPQTISAAEYDLMPNIMEINGKLIFSWDYNTDLFDRSTIEEISKTYLNILVEILKNNVSQPEKISLLGKDDYQSIVFDRNATYRDFDKDLRIHDFVTKTSRTHGSNKAVVHGNMYLTYTSLEKISNQYAHTIGKHLQSSEGQIRIGILDNAHLDIIPLILGILKSGNIYVPINPSFPEERIRYIVEDSGMEFIFTSLSYSGKLNKFFNKKIFEIDSPSFNLSSIDSEVNTNVNPTDLAYIIYTSGSTGVPKGVQIQHRSVVNLLFFMQKQLKLTEKDVICSVSNLSTDMAVPDYYLPHMTGASIVLLDKEDRLEPSKLIQILEKNQVSLMQASPSLLRNLVINGWEGQQGLQIISGAEPLPAELAQSLENKCKTLWNWYGPTETTVWSTFLHVEKAEQERPIVSIGSPIDNTSIYILDKNKMPVPDQIPGELFIAGAGVSPGYLNKPELNSKSFVKNPFSTNPFDSVMYKTGDKARFLSDGRLEYQGRLDFQVKLRGNRVELGEIETLLRKCPLIKEAAAIVYQQVEGNVLVAYVEPGNENIPDKKEIYEHLRKYLPDFMLPNYIELFYDFRYTDNGKLDRSIFPKDFAIKEERKVTTFNQTEKKIAEVWSQVLNHKNFDVTNDFFMVGGNSLLLANVYEKIKADYKVNISLSEVFKNPSIEGIANAIQKSKE